MARTAQPGRVQWIGVRPDRRAPIRLETTVRIGPGGIAGDRGRAGKRAVTLIQHEHLAAIGAFLGRAPVDPGVLRRNIVVAGVNLAALRGRRLRIGGALIEITTVCAPCSRMEHALGHGGYAAMRGHGGWCAAVLVPGIVRLGDAVMPEAGS